MSEDQQKFKGRDLTEALAAARKHFKLSRRDIQFEVVSRPNLGPVVDDEHAVVEILAWARPGATPGSGEAEGEEPRPQRERRRGEGGAGGPRRRGRRRERDREERRSEEIPEIPDLLPEVGADLEPEALVRHLSEALIRGLDLDLRVESVDRNPMGLRVQLAGDDVESLLDEKAEGLEMFQYLANRILHRDERVEDRVSFDAGGYREEREQRLLQKARAICQEVRETGEARKMPPMGAYERRLVHLTLLEEPGIRSYSSGSGGKRRLHVAPEEGEPDSEEGSPTDGSTD